MEAWITAGATVLTVALLGVSLGREMLKARRARVTVRLIFHEGAFWLVLSNLGPADAEEITWSMSARSPGKPSRYAVGEPPASPLHLEGGQDWSVRFMDDKPATHEDLRIELRWRDRRERSKEIRLENHFPMARPTAYG